MSGSAFNPWRRGRKLAATVGAVVVLGGSAYTAYWLGAPGHPGGQVTAQTAHLWVATTGSATCTRNASAVSYQDAVSGGNVCDTGPDAYAAADLGDQVLVKGGTYTTRWNFTTAISKTGTTGTCDYNYGGSLDLSGCVLFKPASSDTVTFNVTGTATGAIKICANFVAIENVTVAKTTYSEAGTGDTLSNTSVSVGSGDSTCQPGGAPPHDIYLHNINYGGQSSVLGGAYNVWRVGGTATGTNDLPWQMGGKGNNGATTGVHDSGIVGVTFRGYDFVNDDSANHHMECLHMDFWGDSNVVAGSSFQDCPVYSIRIEAEGASGYQTNHLIENNFFDGQQLNFDCHDNGCTLTGNTVRFNSFNSASFQPTNDCALNAGNTCTASSNVYYGNLGGGCPSSATGFGGGWTTSYSVFAGAQTGICTGDATSNYSASVGYVSPGTPSYNLDLSGAQTASGFVPSAVMGGWPTDDIHGMPRTGSVTNAGAD